MSTYIQIKSPSENTTADEVVLMTSTTIFHTFDVDKDRSELMKIIDGLHGQVYVNEEGDDWMDLVSPTQESADVTAKALQGN